MSVLNGGFAGIQRNELIAFIVGSTRLVLAALLFLVAFIRPGLLLLAVVFAAVNLCSYFVTWLVYRRTVPVRLSRLSISRSALDEIWRYCGSMTVWMVAMLLVSGMDTAIVARVDFARVAAYSACLSPITMIAGLQQALFSPLLYLGASQASQWSAEEVGAVLVRATRLAVLTSLVPSRGAAPI